MLRKSCSAKKSSYEINLHNCLISAWAYPGAILEPPDHELQDVTDNSTPMTDVKPAAGEPESIGHLPLLRFGSRLVQTVLISFH